MPAQLERWETAGGTWRVGRVGTDSATVELCRCDVGEVVEVLELHDAAEVRWVAQHAR
jgi:hypothetical protein